MLSLDQVRLLENRVEKAVQKIQSLVSENTHLHNQLTSVQTRVNELEGLVRAFKDDQSRIEEGIINALDRLSEFEESSFSLDAQTTTSEIAETQPSSTETIVQNTIPEQTAASILETENESVSESESVPIVETNRNSNGQIDIF